MYLKSFLGLLEHYDAIADDNIELLGREGLESSLSVVRLDTSSFGLIGNAYASLFDAAKLIISGLFSVSIGISFPWELSHIDFLIQWGK